MTNLRRSLSVVIFALFCTIAVGAQAQAKDSSKMDLHLDATVAGSHLASGSYTVQWQTHSPEATVSFLRGNKVVAEAEGKVTDRGSKYKSNEVVFSENVSGARTIMEIRFKGSSEVIEFNQ